MIYRIIIEMDKDEAEAHVRNDFAEPERTADYQACLSSVLRDYGTTRYPGVVVRVDTMQPSPFLARPDGPRS